MNKELPLFISPISAGFPSPAEDSIEKKLDLNDLMIQHPTATFFVRVQGDSMSGAGISEGDILVVDRALTPTEGKIVVAIYQGEFTVKRISFKNNRWILSPENPKYPPLIVQEGNECTLWGVVTYVIRKL